MESPMKREKIASNIHYSGQKRSATSSVDNNNDPGGSSSDTTTLLASSSSGPQKSADGWTLFISGIHPDAEEDEIIDQFTDYGYTKIELNKDMKTGRMKGYGLVRFKEYSDAQDCINELHGKDLYDDEKVLLRVNWAFVQQPLGHQGGGEGRQQRRRKTK